MRAAVLFYGVLNTFERIYLDPDRSAMTAPGCLEALGVDHDVFVATADKAFFKKFPAEAIDGDAIYGLPLIGVSRDDYYHVALYSAERARSALRQAFGQRLKSVTVEETAYDPEIWNGPGMYAHMIRTFFRRKLDAFGLMEAAEAESGRMYDLVFIVRPDSQIRARKFPKAGSKRVARVLGRDLEKFAERPELLFVDHAAFNPLSKRFGLLKNDIAFGSRDAMRRFLGIADVVESNGGDFKRTYPTRAFRDPKTMMLLDEAERDASPDAASMTDVTLWPEYKMFEHLKALGTPARCARVTGGVVR